MYGNKVQFKPFEQQWKVKMDGAMSSGICRLRGGTSLPPNLAFASLMSRWPNQVTPFLNNSAGEADKHHFQADSWKVADSFKYSQNIVAIFSKV